MPAFRIMTYNVLYGGVGREGLIRDVVSAIRPDIAVFTEVTGANSFATIAEVVGPYHAGRDGRGRREYPVIVSRWPLAETVLHGPPWAPRKWVAATVRPCGGGPVTVHGIHLVPQPLWPMEIWRRQEVRYLLNRLQRDVGAHHLVAGDFNALAAGDSQRREDVPAWIRAQWLLQGGDTPRWALKVLTGAGYVDCYRTCHPRAEGFTVPSWSPAARIDYVFASANLANSLRGAGVPASATQPASQAAPGRSLAQLMGWKPVASIGGLASDHLPVWADFDVH